MKKILKIIIILFSINLADAKLAESIVAVVNNEIILLSELNQHIKKSSTEGQENDKAEYLTELVNLRIIEIQARKMGIEVTDEQLESIIKEMINKNGKDNFLQELERQKKAN